MMKVLFGGSFDPIHLGHIYLIRKVIEKYKPEKFIIVPAYQSIGKRPHTFDCEFRLKLILKALSNLPEEIRKYIEVSDYELKQKRPVFTYETILNLKPNTLLVGADLNYTEWKFFYEVIDNYIDQIIVFPRNNYLISPRYRKEIIIDTQLLNFSSSVVREKLYFNESIKNLVSSSIRFDIEKKYLEQRYSINNDKLNYYHGCRYVF